MRRAANHRTVGGAPPPDRAALVAAARTAFDRLGSAATLPDIAGDTGIHIDLFVREFGDRTTLVAAVLDDLLSSLRADDTAEAVAAGPASTARAPHRLFRHAVGPLAALAAMMPLTAMTALPTASAEPAPEPAPATVLTVNPMWPVMSMKKSLGGSMCESGDCESVHYMPFFTKVGVNALDRRLSATTGTDNVDAPGATVLAFSNGAVVAQDWILEHAEDPDAPSPDHLSFVLIGNPHRTYGGSEPAPAPTGYHIIDIVHQYDPVADYPDHPNLLALANISLGILSPLHLDYTDVSLDDPTNVVWTEGDITYVFVPTQNLPLLEPLRRLGMGRLADKLNEPLKEIIERAYDRPYLVDDSSAEETEPVADDATASEPTMRFAANRAESPSAAVDPTESEDGLDVAGDDVDVAGDGVAEGGGDVPDVTDEVSESDLDQDEDLDTEEEAGIAVADDADDEAGTASPAPSAGTSSENDTDTIGGDTDSDHDTSDGDASTD